MGKLQNKEKKQMDSVFRTKDAVNKPEVIKSPGPDPLLMDVKEPGAVKEVRKTNDDFLREEDAEYFEGLLKSGKHDSLAQKITVMWNPGEGEQEGFEWKQAKFTQVTPVAKKGKFFASAEENAVSRCKKTFIHADLCTAKELDLMTEYLGKRKDTIPAVNRGKDVPSDPVLNDYVDKIISMDINANSFTDEYLSKNVAKLYEYGRYVQKYEEMKVKYPSFFESLPEEKKLILESRAKWGIELGGILFSHLSLHGISIREGQDGKQHAVLKKVKTDDKEARRKARAAYNKKLKTFLDNNFMEEQLRLTEVISENMQTGAEDIVMALEKKIAKDQRLASLCGDELRTAVGEVRRILKIRDELTDKVKELKVQRDLTLSDELREEEDAKLARISSSILYATRCADHYREFIDFLLGEKDRVSPEAAGFIVQSGKEELVNILVLKDVGDLLKDTITAKDRMAVMKEIENLKRTGSDPARLQELELSLNDGLAYKKRSREAFLTDLELYREAKDRKKAYDALMTAHNKNAESANAFGEEMAEKYHLQRNNDRVGGVNYNPFGNVENYQWLLLATRYTPTDKTPEDIKNEIVEKGVRPLLNRFLAMTPDDIVKMRLNGEPDVKDPALWENLSLMKTGFVMPEFIQVAEKYNVTLAREEYTHLIALGRVINNNIEGYNSAMTKISDPLNSLLDSPDFAGKGVDLYKDVFVDLHSNMKPPAEVKKVFAKYDKDKTGYTLVRYAGPKKENVPLLGAYFTSKAYISSGSQETLDANMLYNREYGKVYESREAGNYKKREAAEEPVQQEKKEEPVQGVKEEEPVQEEKKEEPVQEKKEEPVQEEKKEESVKKEKKEEKADKSVLKEKEEINVTKSAARKSGSQASSGGRDYAEYVAAVQAVGTKIGFFTSRDMTYVKQKIVFLSRYLNKPSKGIVGDWASNRNFILRNINLLEDACSNYCLRKQRERKTTENDTNYRKVDRLMKQLPKLRRFYSSLSEERFKAAAAKNVTFGDIMARSMEQNVEDPQVKRASDAKLIATEHNKQKYLLGGLTVRDASAPDGVNAGGAEGIYRSAMALETLMRKEIPTDEADFSKNRDAIVQEYEKVISNCSTYSINKTPHLSRGKGRLDSVRNLMGIYQREQKFLRLADTGTFDRSQSGKLTWERALTRGLLKREDIERKEEAINQVEDDNRIETSPVVKLEIKKRIDLT